MQDLQSFNNSDYKVGAGSFKQVLWYFTSIIFFKSPFHFYALKRFLLKVFGAKVGNGVIIKPYVNIKYPWKLTLGNHIWIGEQVWIDNLDDVTISDNCCLSQGVMLLCGNHNYKKETFDLFTGNIILEQRVWVCAKSVIGPNTRIGKNVIVKPMSLVTSNLESNKIYGGNPAMLQGERKFEIK